jgi:hypothetical protein
MRGETSPFPEGGEREVEDFFLSRFPPKVSRIGPREEKREAALVAESPTVGHAHGVLDPRLRFDARTTRHNGIVDNPGENDSP